jgi:WD40 repeat protein
MLEEYSKTHKNFSIQQVATAYSIEPKKLVRAFNSFDKKMQANVRAAYSTFVTDFVVAANLSTDGKIMVTTSEDGMVCIWDVADGKLVTTFRGHEKLMTTAKDKASTISLSNDGKTILATNNDGTAGIFSASSCQMLYMLKDYAKVL